MFSCPFVVLCGRWETVPREFAKCRRCRKAKYCGKECQSTAWSEGHRFWCSAREDNEDGEELAEGQQGQGQGHGTERRSHGRIPQAWSAAGIPIANANAEVPLPVVAVEGTATVRPRREREATRMFEGVFLGTIPRTRSNHDMQRPRRTGG